ncbi:MAG TPA: glycosyltransferase [Gemmatimonadales bacterium]|nr:glycosyltransferase [Gemmatimonadales bacterium]
MTAPTESPAPASAAGIAGALVPGDGGRGIRYRPEAPSAQRPGAALTILDVTKYFGPTTGGIRTYLLEKARYVSERPALRQVMVLPARRAGRTEIDGVRCYWLRGPAIPFQHPYRFLVAPRALRRILEQERPDIIEVGSPFAVPWMTRWADRRLGIPMVWFYHSNIPRVIAPDPVRASAGRRRLAELGWRYVRRVSRLFAATFVGSEFAARDLESRGVANVVRVPLGVDLDLFSPDRRERSAQVRRREGWPTGPLAIHIGRLAGEKELDVVLRAWPEVERRTGATLVVVGAGPSEQRYRRMARGKVLWRRFEPDRDVLADLLAAADLYVAPCPIETFGLAALEALASGVPVLSAGEGGVAEKVIASGAGALYPPGDVAACATQAVALFGSDLQALGDRGRAFAERHHSWTTALDTMFAEYRRVLAR